MPIDTAKQAVSTAFSKLLPDEELEIDFHGGEPFFAFDLIRNLCEWIWSQDWPAPYICYATTNGTLVKGPIKEWLKQNSDRFVVGLSLDGNREMHNLNRSGSYDQIDRDFFHTLWPLQPVKMTVSDKTLPFLAEGVQHLHQSGIRLTWNLAYGIDWSDPQYAIEFAAQLKTLSDFYLENPQFEISEPLAMGISALSYYGSVPAKWCGTGTHMSAVDFDGKEYPCHMFLPMTSASPLGAVDWNCDSTFQDARCKDCSILPMCPTCYGNNLVERGNVALRDHRLCDMFKVQLLACAYLRSNLLTRTQPPGSIEIAYDTLQEIEAITKLQTAIAEELNQKGLMV
jgi:radical SAM protein with 4Fe4S-binding SPASM domain